MATKIHISKTGSIVDSNGNEYIEFAETASARNHLKITNTANGSAPILSAVGSSDSNINIELTPKGTGCVKIADGNLMLGSTAVTATAAELNTLDASATTPGTTEVASGDGIITKNDGTMKQTKVDTFDTYFSSSAKTLTNKTLTAPKFINGGYIADSCGAELIVFGVTANAANQIKITNSATGVPPIISSDGETNVDLKLQTSGTGVFQFNATGTNKSATLRLMESDGNDYVQIAAPNAVVDGGNYTLTLPSSVGTTDQVLGLSNNSGALTWINQSGGGGGGGGDITAVVAGTGLTGGATNGDATLNVGAGNGITVNADAIAITPAQTTITSISNASFTTIGRGTGSTLNDDFIEFSNTEVITKVNNTARFNVGASGVSVTGTASVTGATTNSATTSGGKLILACDDNAALETTHRLGVLEFQGSESSSDTLITGAKIEAVAGANWTTTLNKTNIDLYSTVGDNNQAKVLTLTGAGTTSNSNSLKMSSSLQTDTAFPTIESIGHTNAGMAFKTSGTGVFKFSAGGSTTGATLRLMDNGSNYIGIKTPVTLNNSYSIILPTAVGTTNQTLKINSVDANQNATLEWASAGDITAVTAGTNLSGGGSTGAVSLSLNTALTNITSITKDGNTGVSIGGVSLYKSSSDTIVINNNSNITTGIRNGGAINSIFIGGNTGTTVTGDYNTVCGSFGGAPLTTGSGNTLVGADSARGQTLVTGETHGSSSTNTTVVISTNTSGTLSTVDDFYNGQIITVTNGASDNSSDMIALITDYIGGTKTATISVISGSPSNNGTSLDNKAYTITYGLGLTTGSNNTCVGYKTGVSVAGGTNQTSVGFEAQCTGNNQVTLGSSDVTTLRCATSTIATVSDNRDKTDIVDSTYGLDFINNITPRKYTWSTRDGSVRDGKTNIGFIAQELQSAMGEGENDILDLVLDVNPEKLEIKPGNLIPILVKAVKDLSAANTALEARVAALENA